MISIVGYNKKIVRTGSYVEIWEYTKPIFNGPSKTNVEIKCATDKDNIKRRTFEELTNEEQNERLSRMGKTRLEAKWKLLRLVDCNFDDRTSFLTLTTKENIENRDVFNELFKKFINRYNYQVYDTKKRKLRYIAVLERQKRGAYHAHVLLFSVPYIPHKDLLELWGHGAVRINKVDVDSKENRGRYVTKYFEKGIGQELLESFGKKAYLSSRNLKKPIETKVFSNGELEFDSSAILYESNYVSKIYKDGDYIENPVKYRKIKLE